jgi:CubicO group peptidase (beta-lactamase class C family)
VTTHDELTALAASSREACGSTALAWGVVLDGRLAMSGGIGATSRTVFRIASMTKSFTAATVLAQRDAGALRLDDEVPLLAGVTATLDSPPITYRHLLSMGSGLPEDDPWADRHMDLDAAAIELLVADGLRFALPTGTAFEYSNLGYVLLGDRSAATTALLLEPLGLRRTTWSAPDHDDWAPPPPGTDVVGHGAFAGMGGLWSCVADVAAWIAWFDDAFPARDDLDDGPLSRASRREMQQVQRAKGSDGGYGFGLGQIYDERFGTIVSHSGELPGYGSNMRWLPGRGVGVVTLANATYAPMGHLAQEMLGVLDAHGLVPPLVVAVAPALQAAADALVDLLGAWDDGRADQVFADNVALDESYASRAAAARELVAAHGSLQVERVDAASRTRGTVVVGGAGGTFEIEIMLTPLASGCIGRYTIRQ